MATATLTEISLRALKLPDKGQVTYWDRKMTGFGVRCSQGGTRSFVVMHGANRQLTTIGRYPVISLADARQEARRARRTNEVQLRYALELRWASNMDSSTLMSGSKRCDAPWRLAPPWLQTLI